MMLIENMQLYCIKADGTLRDTLNDVLFPAVQFGGPPPDTRLRFLEDEHRKGMMPY